MGDIWDQIKGVDFGKNPYIYDRIKWIDYGEQKEEKNEYFDATKYSWGYTTENITSGNFKGMLMHYATT